MECIMRTTVLLAGFAVTGMIPLTGMAAGTKGERQEMNFTYLQLNGVDREIKPQSSDQTLVHKLKPGPGYGLSGSYAFLPKYFVFGDYADTKSDVSYLSGTTLPLPDLPTDTRVKRYDLGVGTDRPINSRLDVVARAAYSDVDYGKFRVGSGDNLIFPPLSAESGDRSSTGYLVDAGVRAELAHNLQGTLGARYMDVGTIKSTDVIGSLLFEVSGNWGIDVGVDAGSDISTYQVGVRFSP